MTRCISSCLMTTVLQWRDPETKENRYNQITEQNPLLKRITVKIAFSLLQIISIIEIHAYAIFALIPILLGKRDSFFPKILDSAMITQNWTMQQLLEEIRTPCLAHESVNRTLSNNSNLGRKEDHLYTLNKYPQLYAHFLSKKCNSSSLPFIQTFVNNMNLINNGYNILIPSNQNQIKNALENFINTKLDVIEDLQRVSYIGLSQEKLNDINTLNEQIEQVFDSNEDYVSNEEQDKNLSEKECREILELGEKELTRENVTESFKNLSLKHHSDKGGEDERFIKLKTARDFLNSKLPEQTTEALEESFNQPVHPLTEVD